MAFVKFMRNKFFHPHTYENQKRTWIAEQKHESEKKKQEELHKQYLKEQAIYENKNLLKHGKLTQDDKLSFMYEPPLQCRKKDEKLELREVRFEWQKNAPRAGDYAKNLDVADCPFGIEVRNTKCIKCGVWGHMNTDKICPLYNRGMNTEDNPPDLGKEDPISLLNSMEKGGLRMRKHAVNAVMDVHDNKYKMLEDEKLDPEVAFIANLTDSQKRKLMKKLNRSGSGVGGVPKAKRKKTKHKKDKKGKDKKKKKLDNDNRRSPDISHPTKNDETEPRNQNRPSFSQQSRSPVRKERNYQPRSPAHVDRAGRERGREHFTRSQSPDDRRKERNRTTSRSHSPKQEIHREHRRGAKSPQPSSSKTDNGNQSRQKEEPRRRHDSTDSSEQESNIKQRKKSSETRNTNKDRKRRETSGSGKPSKSENKHNRHDSDSSESDSKSKDVTKRRSRKKSLSPSRSRNKGKEKRRHFTPSSESESDSETEKYNRKTELRRESDSKHKKSSIKSQTKSVKTKEKASRRKHHRRSSSG